MLSLIAGVKGRATRENKGLRDQGTRDQRPRAKDQRQGTGRRWTEILEGRNFGLRLVEPTARREARNCDRRGPKGALRSVALRPDFRTPGIRVYSARRLA